MLKDKYVEAIRAAGFRDIRIVQEAPFSLEYLTNDPTAKAIMEDSSLPPNELRGIASSIISLGIFAVKSPA
jgi:hypothetical protein